MNKFFILILVSLSILPLSAQQSCYERYFREHGKEILPPIDESDNSYDELKKVVIARQLLREETPYAQYIADRYEQPTAKHGVQSQALHQPILLAIDTLTGTCHLLAEDGTILADVHLAKVDSTWYMWLSVDPLADKNIANSPYMYCNGNPIMLVDPDGRDEWQYDENSSSFKNSQQHGTTIVVYKNGKLTRDKNGIPIYKWGKVNNWKVFLNGNMIGTISGNQRLSHENLDSIIKATEQTTQN